MQTQWRGGVVLLAMVGFKKLLYESKFAKCVEGMSFANSVLTIICTPAFRFTMVRERLGSGASSANEYSSFHGQPIALEAA
jgi:hypothetical protein